MMASFARICFCTLLLRFSSVDAAASLRSRQQPIETEDFSGIDSNGDGPLDYPAELLQVPVSNASTQSGKAAPVGNTSSDQLNATKGLANMTSDQLKASKIPLHVATSLAIEQPANAKPPPGKLEAPMPKEVVAAAAKPSPVERMVKHFAQVLRTAEVVPYRPAKAENYEATKRAGVRQLPTTAVEVTFHSGGVVASGAAAVDTRAAVQSAAKEVAEQLSLAESAQTKARVLDRKAAEQRANATVLAKVTTQEALNAGAAAAHSKANEMLSRIAKLEDEAERAQVRSAALHSKAALETEEASELMAIADRALSHGPAQSK